MDALSKILLKVLEAKGDDLAVWDNGTTFTYSEFFDYAFRVMAKLSKDGVKKGDYVTGRVAGIGGHDLSGTGYNLVGQ